MTLAPGPGVLAHVGERLLDDAEGRQVEALGELARLALDREADVEARGARLLEEPVEVGQTRLRRALGGVVAGGSGGPCPSC